MVYINREDGRHHTLTVELNVIIVFNCQAIRDVLMTPRA